VGREWLALLIQRKNPLYSCLRLTNKTFRADKGLDAYKANAAGKVTVASTKVQGVVNNSPFVATTTSYGATSISTPGPTSTSTTKSDVAPGTVSAFPAQWMMVVLIGILGVFVGGLMV
jgi:hypothetical protein